MKLLYFSVLMLNMFRFQDNVTSFSDSFGNVSRLVGAYEASNGILIKLDSVLTPPPSAEGSTMVRMTTPASAELFIVLGTLRF